jgi:hypothetical protein
MDEGLEARQRGDDDVGLTGDQRKRRCGLRLGEK